jgi:hypothetical protein
MAKMIFDKEEIRNIMMMLKSEDADNHIIAFETLRNINTKKSIGELLVLFKYGGHNLESWKTNCSPLGSILEGHVNSFVSASNLTGPKTLSLIIENKGSENSIELFMEYFVRDMTSMLEQIGYPVDNFEINIKLKENGQATKSK